MSVKDKKAPLAVLHVIPSISLAHGGPSRAIRLMEQAQRALGMTVFTLTTDDDGPGRRLSDQESRDPNRYYARKRLEFYKVSPGLLPWLLQHVREYDVVHVHALFSFSSVLAAWVARLRGVPYVVRPLGTLTSYGVSQRRPALKRLSLRFIEGPILRHAAAIHFTSAIEWREAEALGFKLRGVVIPLGVPVSQQVPRSRPECRSLLFLSRLDPKKNLESLLTALARLRVDGLKPTLQVAGSGRPEYVEGLRTLANSLGVSDQVRWLGEIDGDAKAALWAESDVFILPSFSENFGIAAAEALLAGLPCILGIGVAIASEAAIAGAAIAVAPDAESVARALRELLGDSDRCAQMSVRARELALREYSTETMGKRLVALYERIIRPVR